MCPSTGSSGVAMVGGVLSVAYDVGGPGVNDTPPRLVPRAVEATEYLRVESPR
jgi:hypothetical protein